MASAPLTIALATGGDDAAGSAKWPRALRGADGVTLATLEATADDELLREAVAGAADAIVIAGGLADLPSAIKRAVLAGLHVLVTSAPSLTSKQYAAIDEVARRRSRIVLFDVPGFADERAAFVRKMTLGDHALWQPRYIRSTRTGDDGTGRTLDELAIADLALVLSLAGGVPTRVSAVAPRADDESGAAGVALMTLIYESGFAARVDVSLAEPLLRHEVAVACEGRTLLLDAFDMRAPLQIQASARHGGPQPGGNWAETTTEHPLPDRADRIDRAADAFAAGVRARDASLGNAAALAQAALVWETARASIARSGELVALDAESAAESERPALRLIVGGGRTASDQPPPELKLVRSPARITRLPDGAA